MPYSYIIQKRNGEVVDDFTSADKVIKFVQQQKCPLFNKKKMKERHSSKEFGKSNIKELAPLTTLNFYKQARSKVPHLSITKVVRH